MVYLNLDYCPTTLHSHEFNVKILQFSLFVSFHQKCGVQESCNLNLLFDFIYQKKNTLSSSKNYRICTLVSERVRTRKYFDSILYLNSFLHEGVDSTTISPTYTKSQGHIVLIWTFLQPFFSLTLKIPKREMPH